MTEKTKAYLRIAGIAGLFIAMIVIIFISKVLWIKILAGVIGAFLGWILYRTITTIIRKKQIIYGKVLSITPPKNKFKFGKTVVLVKAGKVTKKLYSWQPIKAKIGSDYGFYYEEKSSQILKFETVSMNTMQRPKGNKIPPQFR